MNKKLIRKMLTASGGPIKRLNFSPEFIASIEQLATRIPGTNTNSNYTVGQTAREAGVRATALKLRNDPLTASRVQYGGEMHTYVPSKTHQDPISKEVIVDEWKDEGGNSSGAMSGADPIGEFFVAGAALNPVFKLAGKGALYGMGISGNNWARAKLISGTMDRMTPRNYITNAIANPTKYDISDNITLYRASPTSIKNPSYKGERYGDTSGLYVGKWFTDEPSKPNLYASNMAKRGEEPAYYLVTVPRYWAKKQKASYKISNSNIEYEPEDYIIEDGILGLQGQLYQGRPGTIKYLLLNFLTPIMKEPSTSLKFFERRPSKLSEAERAGVPKGDRNFTPQWHVANYPGYLLKGLMKGSLLEKQLSKNGTININLLNAYFNKASQLEKEVASKVLAEKFAGLKTIDYNLFKKAVLDELINYDTKPQVQYSTYGMDKLGFNVVKESDGAGGIIEYLPKVRTNTFTFESPRIPAGNSKHYDPTTLGHSRTYTTPEEPRVLHVMESQSDWAQAKNSPEAVKTFNDLQKKITDLEAKPNKTIYDKIDLEVLKRLKKDLLNLNGNLIVDPQLLHLRNNYLQRQLQENLRYAAEKGLTKMRYPTPETAAKIEGYLSKTGWFTPEGQELNPLTSVLFNPATGNFETPVGTVVKQVYSPEHQTILKKYADFPKLFLKLFKDLKVKTATDTKGNTWYEVDVPKGYLSREWQFKQGGKMNILEFLKNGSGIHIKKKNRGSFTRWCGGNVTLECIRRGKNSSNPKIRKKATFADNARHFKHRSGGLIVQASDGSNTKNWWSKATDWIGNNKDLLQTGFNAFSSIGNIGNASKALNSFDNETQAGLNSLNGNIDLYTNMYAPYFLNNNPDVQSSNIDLINKAFTYSKNIINLKKKEYLLNRTLSKLLYQNLYQLSINNFSSLLSDFGLQAFLSFFPKADKTIDLKSVQGVSIIPQESLKMNIPTFPSEFNFGNK